MIHALGYSGGKDSTALYLWMLEQREAGGPDFLANFCDTGWEHDVTYDYLWTVMAPHMEAHGVRLNVLRSAKYDGFADLCVKRGRVPSAMRRFCTQELKIFPLHAWIESQDDDVTTYQGVRAQESARRARMCEQEFVNDAGGYWIRRPIFRWTHDEVFEIHRRHGIPYNPLYLMGMGRVGCAPCIMVNLREFKTLLQCSPEIIVKLRELEAAVEDKHGNARSFFASDTIPERFHSRVYVNKDGQEFSVCTVDDVANYVLAVDEDQLPLWETPKCVSVYNLCE